MPTGRQFTLQDIENVARAIGDTDSGLKKWEIQIKLRELGMPAPNDDKTKWAYLCDILQREQEVSENDSRILDFLHAVMRPAAFASTPDRWDFLYSSLNRALAFVGYQVAPDGSIKEATPAQTLEDAMTRADRLHDVLKKRGVHEDVLKACRAELLVSDYFHAVLEATKSVAEKIRRLSGLTDDGSTLCDQAFGGKEPMLLINNLSTDSEVSEHNGFLNLLKGLFGTFRNPTAHVPRLDWRVDEQDAVDLMTLTSYFHRRLDQSHRNIERLKKPK